MRARNIKPSLFSNELLGTANPLLTILFIGLWCCADREGRLENRPLRIKAHVFPYRQVDVEPLLAELQRMGFIDCYAGVIQVVNFKRHQHPHFNEVPSELPTREKVESTCDQGSKSVSLIPESLLLIPDSLLKDIPQTSFEDSSSGGSGSNDRNPTDAQIERLYQLYPKKVDKQDAKKAIAKAVKTVMGGDHEHPAMPLEEALDFLAERINKFAESTKSQDKQFIKYPATWFNAGSFWDDPAEWGVSSKPRQTKAEREWDDYVARKLASEVTQ